LVSRRNCFLGLSLSPNRAILLVKPFKIPLIWPQDFFASTLVQNGH
jgi:hypothetical protein